MGRALEERRGDGAWQTDRKRKKPHQKSGVMSGKKEIYFSFVLEVEDDNRVLKSIVRNNSGIMMYKRRYRLGAVYNRYYNRLEILPLYRYSRCKKQYEKMKKDLLDCLGISDVVQA